MKNFPGCACLFIVAISLNLSAQYAIYKKDFLYQDKPCQLMASKTGGVFHFSLLCEANHEFTMLTLDNISVFNRLLKDALVEAGAATGRTLSVDDLVLGQGLFVELKLHFHSVQPDASPAGRVIIKEGVIPAFCRDIERARDEFGPVDALSRDSIMDIIARHAAEPAGERIVFARTAEDLKHIEILRQARGEDSLQSLRQTANEYLAVMEFLEPSRKSNCSLGFRVDSVQLEFENGALHNIKAIGTINGKVEIFENFYPLSWTTKLSVNPPNEGFVLRNVIGRSRLIIYTKDLLYYDYNLLLRTENYAPVDQVVYVQPGSEGRLLYKEKTSEILQARVFTDLVGLDEDRPHGILQLEFSKPVNLLTRTHYFSRFGSPYLVFLNRVTPAFAINKIEEDDNRLPVRYANGLRYAGYSDIMQYRQASLGFSLELLRVGLPAFQSIYTIGFNYNYHLVRFTDMRIDTNFTNLSRDLGLELGWHINPSDKYNFTLGYAPRWFRYYPDDMDPVLPVKSLTVIPTDVSTVAFDENVLYHSFEFLAVVRLGRYEELFFRTRYHFLDANDRQNYFQVQLGYAFYFFRKNP